MADSISEKKITVCFDKFGVPAEVTADYVVLATPLPVISLLEFKPELPADKDYAIRTTRYVEVTKVLAQFDKSWWVENFDEFNRGRGGGVVTDLPLRYLVFPASRAEDRAVVLASYTFEQDAYKLGVITEVEKRNIIYRCLTEIFGEKLILDSIEVSTSQNWSADGEAGGAAFCYFGPYQYTNHYELLKRPEFDDTLYLIGEHVSGWHGWILGALESAEEQVIKIELEERKRRRS